MHPRANRETVLEGMHVAYLFQRVRRRSIGFVVGPDGLEVRAPKWVTIKEVELGLQERGEWVLRKWAEMRRLDPEAYSETGSETKATNEA